MTHNPLDDPRFLRKVALVVGLIALAVGGRMSYKFGEAMSYEHGCFLALIAVAGCIIFPVAGLTSNKALRNVGLLFLAIELFSHIGYSVGMRVMNTEQTGVHNAAYATKQDSVKRNAETLASLKQQLADLTAQNAWATTVSADGLRGQIPALDEAIRQEAGRGGCGPKCLALQEKKADVENRIGVAEKVDDLTSKIEIAQKLVNAKEDEAVHAEFTTSPVVAQTKFVSQIWTMSLEPDNGSLTGTQIFIGILLALGSTFLAPTMFTVAFGAATNLLHLSKPRAPASEKLVDGEVSLLRAKLAEMQSALQRAPQARAEPMQVHLHGEKGLEANGTLAAVKRLLDEGRYALAAKAA